MKKMVEVAANSVAWKNMESEEAEYTSVVVCNCKLYQNRFEKLKKKYTTLRKNHRKLLDVTAVLTDALEQFIKGDDKIEISNALKSCSSIYPDLFEISKPSHLTVECEKEKLKFKEKMVEKSGKLYDTGTESEKEYYEGFLARPKIPRTPQV